MGKYKCIWITWEKQRRNRELSAAFGAKLFELSEIDDIKRPILKYGLGLLKTTLIILREKPQLIICQNPSIVLSFFLVFCKVFLRIYVCVDAHNAGIYPMEGSSKILGFLSEIIQKKADLTIVSNNVLAKVVKGNGGKPFVLQDKIPFIPSTKSMILKGKHNILFICSFGIDEPYWLIFEAASEFNPNVYFYITGNYHKKDIKIDNLPNNVILTGFIPDDDYVKLLRSVDITIDLTTRENCLVCGAYESVAVGKPMILSKTRALQDYFNQGAVFTDNNVSNIKSSIVEALNNLTVLKKQLKELKRIKSLQWERERKKISKIFLKMYKGTF